MSQTAIAVDIELHRLIEMHRESFTESQYEIVFRALSGGFGLSSKKEIQQDEMSNRPRMPRRGGTYYLQMLGQKTELYSLKEVLRHAILAAEQKSSGFIEKLSQHRTSRGRRIVARKPGEIYPGNSELVKSCAEKLDNKWWYDTNISNDQCRRYLSVIAKIGGFEEPKLLP